MAFRTRLFLLATAVVTVVLGVVLSLGWFGLVRNEIQRLEDRLCLEARRVATQPRLTQDPRRLEVDLKLRLRLGDRHALLLHLEPGPDVPPLRVGDWTQLPGAEALPWRVSARLGPPPMRPPPGSDAPPPEGDLQPPPPDAGFRPPPPGAGLPPPRGQCEVAAATLQGQPARAARFTTPRSRALLVMPLAAVTEEMQADLGQALRIVVPLALGLTALGAWLLSSLTLRPVVRLRKAMQAQTLQAPDRRVDPAGEDREFRDLIEAYNTMLSRLEACFQQASRFSADAAHELKTPLTILQGRLEQAIRQSDRGAVQTDLSEMLDEVGQLTAITRKLLLLSQADSGQLALNRERVDLAELLETLVADLRMLETGQPVRSQVQPGLATQGDALLLRQLLNNLLSNALRHGRPGGWIAIDAQRRGERIEVRFANACAPISTEARGRFFDRFHRGDSTQGRTADGHGLGLSLAREIARAHGGDLQLLDSPPDEVRLQLTLAAA